MFTSLIRKIKAFVNRKYYVILDGTTGNITMSQSLRDKVLAGSDGSLSTFIVKQNGKFAFTAADHLKGQAEIHEAHVEGAAFTPDDPSVSHMLWKYCLPYNIKVKLSVTPDKTDSGIPIYIIEPPCLPAK
nr:MAG TPA: hypothetical protein [Caudoviricetes sp.]